MVGWSESIRSLGARYASKAAPSRTTSSRSVRRELKSMSESPDAQFTQANMVRFERTIHASSNAIWSVLTDTARLPGWYGEGRIEGRVGGAVSLMGGHIRGTVTRWLPPKKLSY